MLSPHIALQSPLHSQHRPVWELACPHWQAATCFAPEIELPKLDRASMRSAQSRSNGSITAFVDWLPFRFSRFLLCGCLDQTLPFLFGRRSLRVAAPATRSNDNDNALRRGPLNRSSASLDSRSAPPWTTSAQRGCRVLGSGVAIHAHSSVVPSPPLEPTCEGCSLSLSSFCSLPVFFLRPHTRTPDHASHPFFVFCVFVLFSFVVCPCRNIFFSSSSTRACAVSTAARCLSGDSSPARTT